MKKTINLLVAVLCISVFFKTSTAQTSYEAINDGLWDSPLTWEPEGVPGESDIAVNPGAFEISITGDFTVAEYHQIGGTLYINGSLTILNNGSWENGHIIGTGSPEDAQINIPETAEFTLIEGFTQGKLLDVIELNNMGTITIYEGFAPTGATVINNYGLFDYAGNLYIGSSGPSEGTFNNYGTIRKSLGGGNTNIAAGFATVNHNGTIEVNAGILNFYGDIHYINGNYIIDSGAELLMNGGDILMEGTLDGSPAGDFTMRGSGNLIIPEDSTVTLNFSNNGALWAGVEIIGGGTLHIPDGAVFKSVYSGSARILSGNTTILNQGTFLATIGFAQFDGSAIINEGLFEITDNCVFGSSVSTNGGFENYGTVLKSGGTASTSFAAGIVFTNHHSEIDVQEGEIQTYGTWNLMGGNYSMSENTEINFGGTLNLSGILTGSPAGDFILASADVVVDTEATLNFQGTGVQWSGSDIMGGGILTNAETGLIQIVYGGSARIITDNTTLVNNGTVEASYGIAIQNGAVFRNNGIFNILDNTQFSGGGSPEGVFENYGSLIKSGGDGNSNWQADLQTTNFENGIIDAAFGTLRFYTLTNNQGATIQGNATFYAPSNFPDYGIVSPGSSPGILNWKINYQPSGSSILDIEIGGLTPGEEHDQLIVNGYAGVDGTLQVSLIDGFVPVAGDTFVIISAEAVTDTFQVKQFPDELFMSVHYNSDNVTLVVDSVGALSVTEMNDLVFSNFENYPNPFNKSTTFTFELKETSFVSLDIFDLSGHKVAELINANLPAGEHIITWHSGSLTSGHYLGHLQINGWATTRKLIITK
ncbi:MAG TPA: T9SS type A sorting domain-containing protein [Bacteroidales bacterium]|nr:T9SS type A sorting domain-containing protein [Bacteroidales bacterium]HRX98375.1 T9SS type A sorting domain-containing protein [Bacteroidales bacterium]